MGDTAISVRNLGKMYRLGSSRGGYGTLRDVLAGIITGRSRRVGRKISREGSWVWALRDVSFSIRRGETVGIIGPNGAGKSTLLKILSRITEPTEGYAEIRGRVGSLLEVGTGFHPELTGRENVYLSGAILGMKRKEINDKFAQIVSFSGIEKFLDTPVKHYSSGMYVRLAFAVAAHLDSEIVIVDEVLAVGDSAFQKKCLAKMREMAQEGRTVLFVSHNLTAVSKLCRRAIYFLEGRLRYDGPADSAIDAYVGAAPKAEVALTRDDLAVKVNFFGPNGSRATSWREGEELIIQVAVRSRRPLYEPAIDLSFYTPDGARLCTIQSNRLTNRLEGKHLTSFCMVFSVHNPGLTCGQVSVDLGIRSASQLSYIGVWNQIETLLVQLRRATDYAIDGTVIWLPSKVEVVEDHQWDPS